MWDNDGMSFRSRTGDKWRLGLVAVIITSALTAQVCFQVCVCVHGRKVTSLKHIQVQALHYSFYICTVGKWLGNCSQFTYPVAGKTSCFARRSLLDILSLPFKVVMGLHCLLVAISFAEETNCCSLDLCICVDKMSSVLYYDLYNPYQLTRVSEKDGWRKDNKWKKG